VTPRHADPLGREQLGRLVVVCASCGATGVAIAWAFRAVACNRMAPWIIGRAAGISAYLLLFALVLSGLLLSHPWRSRITRPSPVKRIRVHIALANVTLAVTVLHIVVLATDRYAGVGWWGAVLPMRASYRPAAVTLGLIGVWLGLLAGITAALAGRLPARAWWPIHKVAAAAFVLGWLHGVLAGGDTDALRWLYLGTGAVVVGVALSRYGARSPADQLAELGG
jgi:hypothetical protein